VGKFNQISISSEQDAVGLKSGEPVAHSGPVLRRPTSRQSRLNQKQGAQLRPALPQPKSGQGCGDRVPANFACNGDAQSLTDADVAALIHFFQILDRWDRELHDAQIM
jgi:hypothetical protein